MICPFQPVVPNDVLAIRTAPGLTKRARWPSVKYSAFWLHVSPSTVMTPVQVSQPPLYGRPSGRSATFQLTTVLPQLRVTPSTTLRACHLRVSAKNFAGGSSAPWEPEHSVNQTPLSRKRCWSSVCRAGSPA